MANTPEGIPIVTRKALQQVADEIRSRGTAKLFEDLENENRLLAKKVEKFASEIALRPDQKESIKIEFAILYEMIKCAGRLDQTK